MIVVRLDDIYNICLNFEKRLGSVQPSNAEYINEGNRKSCANEKYYLLGAILHFDK
jgi:hypothetical protein